jgi:outer membrane protein
MNDESSLTVGCQRKPSVAFILLSLMTACTWPGVGITQIAPTAPCSSGPPSDREINLARAVDLALCRNAQIQSAAVTVRIRAAQLGQARAQYWPTLTGTVTELRETTEYPGSRSPSTTDTATTLYGALSWRLFDFGGRRADVRSASRLLEAALASRDAAIQSVLATVVQAYFDCVAARALLETKADDETVARETTISADRRLQRGDAAQSDVLQARSAVARATLELNRAQAAYDKARSVLAYSIGLPVDADIRVLPESEPYASEDTERALRDWLEEARRSHPAIVAARAEVEAARAQLLSARSVGKPTIDFQANYYANGFPQQGLATTRQRSTTVGLAITIPLFDGFLGRYRIHEAEATLSLKETALVDTEQVTLTDIVKAYADATAAFGNLRAAKDLLEAASASQSSAKRRYDSGAADILELLSTQTTLADARQEQIRSTADWRSARLRLLATSSLLSNEEIKGHD